MPTIDAASGRMNAAGFAFRALSSASIANRERARWSCPAPSGTSALPGESASEMLAATMTTMDWRSRP